MTENTQLGLGIHRIVHQPLPMMILFPADDEFAITDEDDVLAFREVVGADDWPTELPPSATISLRAIEEHETHWILLVHVPIEERLQEWGVYGLPKSRFEKAEAETQIQGSTSRIPPHFADLPALTFKKPSNAARNELSHRLRVKRPVPEYRPFGVPRAAYFSVA